jgi:hypothetical protein
MKKVIQISLLFLTITSFIACNGGDNSHFKNAEEKIDITNCVSSPTITDIDNYETIEGGDVIIKKEDNTTISTYHDVDNVKKICVESGSAYILRK